MLRRPSAATICLAAVLAAVAFGAVQAQQQTWVAVATDGRSNFGYAVGMATSEAAEITALGECGPGCRLGPHGCRPLRRLRTQRPRQRRRRRLRRDP